MQRDHDTAMDTRPADRMLDAALGLGELRGWDAFHLHDIARELGVPLSEIHRHFRQKDDLAEAWFDRADRMLLAVPDMPGWTDLPVRERLFQAIMAWLDALRPHRRLTRAMLGYKLHPEHLHLQAHGLTRISRTVQWIREVAQLPATGLRQEAEEVVLTGIYLTTFGQWLRDESPNSSATRKLLQRLLGTAESIANGAGRWLPGSPRES
jgi:AcrR family transcriptional regulator